MTVTIANFPAKVTVGMPAAIALTVTGLFQRVSAWLSDGSRVDLSTPAAGVQVSGSGRVRVTFTAWTVGTWNLFASALDPFGCIWRTTLSRVVTVGN